MAHWDEIIALRDRLGVGTGKQSWRHKANWSLFEPRRYCITKVRFENLTESDQAYLLRKFDLNSGDSIDAEKADIIAASIRQDLNYQSAKTRVLPISVKWRTASTYVRRLSIRC